MIMKSLITKTKPFWIKTMAIAVVGGLLAACTAMPGADDNPVLRKFQWFSYMEGGDFKETCGATDQDRYRMIYNAVYTEQVRIYNVSEQAMAMHMRVMLPMDLRDFAVDSWSGLLDPWRGKAMDIELTKSDFADLRADLDQDGVFGQPNVGAELSSKGFFWTVAACHNGRYHFTAFTWPKQNFDKLLFANRLFDLDRSNIAVNAPRKTQTMRSYSKARLTEADRLKEYHQKVGENGLVGLGPLF
jgi:hypothetical protein